MKHFLSLTLLVILSLSAKAQTVGLSKEMTTYKEAALQMLHAFEQKDKYGLYSAKEKFGRLSLEEDFSLYCQLESPSENPDELKASFFFTPQHINDILAEMDALVEVDPTSSMRAEPILLIHNAIKAGATLSYRSSGEDYCQLLVIPTGGENLKLTVTDETCGKTYSGVQETDSSTWLGWTMSQHGDFVFTIENSTTVDSSFVVAAQ